MSTPVQSPRKRIRLSTKLYTPGSEYGLTRRLSESDSKSRFTPHAQRLRFNVANNSDDSDSEGLEVLLRRPWRVYRVSPLNNFSYTTVRLKQYSRRLREGLTTMQTGPMKEAHYDVTFAVEEGLNQTEHDKEAIRIAVDLIRNNHDSDKEKKLARKFYLGYLISRGSMKSMEDVSIHLPILLCRGSLTTINSVHHLMQKFFDCTISPLRLSQEDLAWICTIVADKSQDVTMQFTFPQVSVKNSLNYKMPHKNLKTLWDKIHDSKSEYVTDEEVKLLQRALIQQLVHVFQIDIRYAQLVQLKTQDLSITRECKVVAKTSETMSQILRILYEVSTIMDTALPTLGEELE